MTPNEALTVIEQMYRKLAANVVVPLEEHEAIQRMLTVVRPALNTNGQVPEVVDER